MSPSSRNSSVKPEKGGLTAVVVDDHPLIAEAVVKLLKERLQFSVRGVAGSAKGMWSFLKDGPVDLVVLDLNLGCSDGIEIVKAIRARLPEQKILVLSMEDELDFAHRVVSAGARGYVSKSSGGDEIELAVQTILSGKTYLSEAVQSLGSDGHKPHPARELTDREFSIFAMLGRGRTTREIAGSLNLSIKTVEKHRENIKGKLKIRTTPKLIAEAAKWVGSRNQRNTEDPGDL